MAKAQGNIHRVKLSDFKAKKELENSIEIEGNDGVIYRCPPPELWSDEVMALAQDDDNLGVARELMGDQYDAFVAAGGGAATLMAIIADTHGISVGESQASLSS